MKALLWSEVVRILTCGPSKRPAPESIYNKSNSHPSMSNLNASSNSLNKGNYMVQTVEANGLDNSGSIYQIEDLVP